MAESDVVKTWLAAVGAALDLPEEVAAPTVLPEEVQAGLLDLTGDIAHSVVRYAVPLTSYLIGVAVGRGASPREALAIVAGLLPSRDDRSS